jgi:hypothetical protein
LYIGVGEKSEKRKKVRKKELFERKKNRASHETSVKKFHWKMGEKNKRAVNSLVCEEIMGLNHTKKLLLGTP